MILGPRGEAIAAGFLTDRGFRIVARNYRCPLGEIDIVAADGDTLVFVEVKSRRSAEAAEPEISVHYDKRRRITRAARYFVSHKSVHDQPLRFDVVAIVLPDHGQPEIEHFEDAFGPTPQ